MAAFIGIQAAAQSPELYHAYVAVAQMSNQLASERLAYEYMLQRFNENGNSKMVRKLRTAPVGDTIPLPDAYLSVRDVAMHSFGVGTMTRTVTRLELPVYFLHGVHDYTVSYPLAKSYYELLDAPMKGFYTFHQSAHSPLFEEPGKTCRIMRDDVLAGATRLADPACASKWQRGSARYQGRNG